MPPPCFRRARITEIHSLCPRPRLTAHLCSFECCARSCNSAELLASQLITEMMQGVMPTTGGQMIHRVPQNDAGAAAAPASAPLLSALDASAALAQGPSPQGPSMPQARAAPSATAGSRCEAGSSADLPPASAPAASVAASAGPAGRPAEGGSSSIDIGGLPDASDLSVHLWALLQAQVNALQPLVHASQQVATSFARELAPLMQMQSPSRAGGPQLPAPTFVAPQTLQGELPMPPALKMLQELQQLQSPPSVPSSLLFPISLSMLPTIPPASQLLQELQLLQSQQPMPSSLLFPTPLSMLPTLPSAFLCPTTGPMQCSTSAIPVHATVDPPAPSPCAHGTGDGDTAGVETSNAEELAPAEHPSLQHKRQT